jgi:hypothetical protein
LPPADDIFFIAILSGGLEAFFFLMAATSFCIAEACGDLELFFFGGAESLFRVAALHSNKE